MKKEDDVKQQVDEDEEGQMDSNLRLEEQDSEEKKENQEIIQDEADQVDKVDYKAIFDYFSFCTKLLGGRYSVFVIILLHVFVNISVSSLSLYLAFSLNALAKGGSGSESNFDSSLLIIMGATFAVTVLGKFVSCLIFMSINKNMYQKVMSSLIYTKMSFFDENTSGAIINRLSADV